MALKLRAKVSSSPFTIWHVSLQFRDQCIATYSLCDPPALSLMPATNRAVKHWGGHNMMDCI